MGQKINLNTATKAELDKIQGIGDNCADEIMNYRSQHGRINSIDDLADIPGFGKKAMEHLHKQAEV